jgi:hypothetical protein
LGNPVENIGYYASGIKMPTQDNYEIAYKQAVEEFMKRDIKEICNNAGVQTYDNDPGYLIVPFINKNIIILYPDIKISYSNNEDIGLWLKILVLHYLINADGTPPSGRQITFKEISGGLSYYPTFQNRAVKPVLKVFADQLDDFILSSEEIGGLKSDYGKYSISFQVFPNIRIIFNIWEGDEELPSDGNVVFDSSITHYLSSEDIVVMCNMIVLMIIKSRR